MGHAFTALFLYPSHKYRYHFRKIAGFQKYFSKKNFFSHKKGAVALRCRRCDLVLVGVLGATERQIATKNPHKTEKTTENSVVFSA